MASWSKDRVEPNAINGGREFTRDDNLALNELNAIVNNSFYASEKAVNAEQTAKKALDQIEDHIVNNGGTVVTINGDPQGTWDAGFIENERKTQINLIGFVDGYSQTNNGYTVTVDSNNVVINGASGEYSANMEIPFSYAPLKLKAGTYCAKVYFVSEYDYSTMGNNISLKLFGESRAIDFFVMPRGVVYTLEEDVEIDKIGLYIQRFLGNANNIRFKLQLQSGNTPTEYTEYVGTILHKGEQPAVFAESERQKSKNLVDINRIVFNPEYSSVSVDYVTGVITINQGANSVRSALKNFTDMQAEKNYTLSFKTTASKNYIYLNSSGFKWENGTSHIITQEELDDGIHIYGEDGYVTTFSNFQIEEGTQATDYQAYNGAIAHKKDILKDFWSGITDTNTWTELTMGDTANLINEYPFRVINNRNIERTTNGLVIKKAGYYYIDFNVSVERTDTTTVNFYIYVKSNDYTTVNRQSNRTGDNLRELVAGSGIIYCEIGDVIKLGMGRDNTNATGKIINLNFTIREV